jgi:hypothetical protein
MLNMSQSYSPPRPVTGKFYSLHSLKDSLDGGSALRKASTYIQYRYIINAQKTSMSRVGFQSASQVLERALDRTHIVINSLVYS